MRSGPGSVDNRNHLSKLTGALLDYRRPVSGDGFWKWIGGLNGEQASKSQANKFFLGAILDFQMKSETAWRNAERFAEEVIGEPSNLWERIVADSEGQWKAKWRQYRLHRFPKGHERVWRIANEIVGRYHGDAREIWAGQTPSMVLMRLLDMRAGEQISRMVLGALIDTQQIPAGGDNVPLDVKADVHVCRVLGRSVYGEERLETSAAFHLTREMCPKLPWLLDEPLWTIGREFCKKTGPLCNECPLNEECSFSTQGH